MASGWLRRSRWSAAWRWWLWSRLCWLTDATQLRLSRSPDRDSVIVNGKHPVSGIPCTNVGAFEDGKLVPKRTKDDGFTYRLNGRTRTIDLVGADEADPQTDRVTFTAPLAQAMLEAQTGDRVEFGE